MGGSISASWVEDIGRLRSWSKRGASTSRGWKGRIGALLGMISGNSASFALKGSNAWPISSSLTPNTAAGTLTWPPHCAPHLSPPQSPPQGMTSFPQGTMSFTHRYSIVRLQVSLRTLDCADSRTISLLYIRLPFPASCTLALSWFNPDLFEYALPPPSLSVALARIILRWVLS